MMRCRRCNALLEDNELVTIRERLVTRHRYNSGRTYKVSAFPRYHLDLAKCDAIYGVKSHPDDLREAAATMHQAQTEPGRRGMTDTMVNAEHHKDRT